MSDVAKDLAKDVAKQLDRRQRRRKLILWAALIALVVFAVMFIRFGGGLGFGGGDGKGGDGPGTTTVDAGPVRCAVRVAAAGITVDGATATQAEVVERCKKTVGADVIVTGDARQGDWDALRTALEAAKVPVYTRDR